MATAGTIRFEPNAIDVVASQAVPTAMILVPSENGVGHDPRGHTSAAGLAVGVGVLLDVVARLRRGGTGPGAPTLLRPEGRIHASGCGHPLAIRSSRRC